MTSYQDIFTFWFDEHGPKQWFQKDELFDALIKERFFVIHGAAAKGELYGWREKAEGRLAEIIILDQFSRNLYRDEGRAFAYDSMALVLAQEAIALGVDNALTTQQRWMLYLPYMHSESLVIHEQAMELFEGLGLEDVMEYEVKHRNIIQRFGRYPHRNALLGRESTADEIEFLKQPDSSF